LLDLKIAKPNSSHISLGVNTTSPEHVIKNRFKTITVPYTNSCLGQSKQRGLYDQKVCACSFFMQIIMISYN